MIQYNQQIKEKELYNMKVLVLSNNKLEEREINNTLEELQKIVGGYIEIPYLGETFRNNNIDVIINEEGKFIEGMKQEMVIISEKNKTILDVVFGNCIFASHDEEGDTIGLNNRQIEIVKNELSTSLELINTVTYETFEAKALYI